MQLLNREKPAQRNITPNYIAIKSSSRTKLGKNGIKISSKEKYESTNHPTQTGRSGSKDSRGSF